MDGGTCAIALIIVTSIVEHVLSVQGGVASTRIVVGCRSGGVGLQKMPMSINKGGLLRDLYSKFGELKNFRAHLWIHNLIY